MSRGPSVALIATHQLRKARAQLSKHGFKVTRAGRWVDQKTGKSYTTGEAWDLIEAREKGGAE